MEDMIVLVKGEAKIITVSLRDEDGEPFIIPDDAVITAALKNSIGTPIYPTGSVHATDKWKVEIAILAEHSLALRAVVQSFEVMVVAGAETHIVQFLKKLDVKDRV